MKKPILQIVIILVFPILFLACSSRQKEKIQLLETSEEMQTEVNNKIPIGLPIEKAKQIMEDSNFSCEDLKNDVFIIEKTNPNGTLKQTRVEGDFLSCSIGRSYFIASESWQVFILYKNNRVIMVYAVINWQNL